jgi:uncharacterized RDD family membrane protein YckC
MGDGVYYAASDYVGLWPRIVILIVDTLVLAVGLVLLAMLVNLIVPADAVQGIFMLLAVAFVWWYEVPLKRSRFRTLGYWLTGCKIVNLRGEPPSYFMLTFRALMWALGPFSFLFDLLWCGIDDDRQTLRDRFSSCCLVKVNAEPIGQGQVQFTRFFAGGFALMYPRVVHRREESVK